MAQQFFYDGQIRRFVIQFIRLISEFQVEFGADRSGNKTLQRVPVYYGDGSRQAGAILRNNSASTMPTVPAMAVYINGLKYDRDRIQNPTFVNSINIRQRQYDANTGTYESTQGNAFTIERLMPVPHELEILVDIWTSNKEQKLQLIEQLSILFNPEMEIQSTDNYIDWTSLSVVYREDIKWSAYSVPIGTETPIDVATMTFRMPIWISAPAKVKKLGVIQKIIANIHDARGDLNTAVYDDTNLLGSREYFTPLDYGILLVGNNLTLLRYNEFENPREPTLSTPTKVGAKAYWRDLVEIYGTLTNGTSQIRLTLDDEVTEIVGTVSYHPTDDSIMLFNPDIDTLPVNTLSAISAIINPRTVKVDSNILTPTTGTRYLILEDIGTSTNNVGASAWRGSDGSDLVAHANDIIEFNGTHWTVSFDSNTVSSVNYVSNLTTGTQYKWNNNQWVKSWEGEYKNGLWTLVL